MVIAALLSLVVGNLGQAQGPLAPQMPPTDLVALPGSNPGEVVLSWTANLDRAVAGNDYRLYGKSKPGLDLRHDDGTAERMVDVRSEGYVSTKYLYPIQLVEHVESARIWIYGIARNCSFSGYETDLRLNGWSIAWFEPCATFPTAAAAWRSFVFPTSVLMPGGYNDIVLERFNPPYYAAYDLLSVGTDQTNISGKSEVFDGGTAVAGDPMIYIELSGSIPYGGTLVKETATENAVESGSVPGSVRYYWVAGRNAKGEGPHSRLASVLVP